MYRRGPGRPEVEISRQVIIHYYLVEKMPLREVAKRLGVSTMTIQRRLKAMGIPRRKMTWL